MARNRVPIVLTVLVAIAGGAAILIHTSADRAPAVPKAPAPVLPQVANVHDRMRITVTDLTPGKDTAFSRVVDDRGNITLPSLGEIKAAGRTMAELEGDISNAYAKAGLVRGATVSVQFQTATTAAP